MSFKVSNIALLDAGISAMQEVGKSMERLPTSSRAMKYQLATGETVRVRTCNDHVLVVLASSAEEGAALNIEGTDYLLIVMPETPRVEGPVIIYLVPTSIAENAVRKAHADWLNTNPSTKGNNRTWNIWFGDGPTAYSGFAQKWAQYRLQTKTSTVVAEPPRSSGSSKENRPLGIVIADAKRAIAEAAGVPIEAVKISVALD